MQAVSYVDITKPVTTLDAKNEVSFAGWQHPVHTVCTHQSQERKADHGFPGKEQQNLCTWYVSWIQPHMIPWPIDFNVCSLQYTVIML